MTSRTEKDIFLSYDLGLSSFITKLATFQYCMEIAKILASYSVKIVEFNMYYSPQKCAVAKKQERSLALAYF